MNDVVKTVSDMITAGYESMTRAEKQLANSLLDNYPVSGLGSITTVAEAAGVSTPTVVRMVGNVLFESMVGVVPFVGDAFDFVWKSNAKNVRLLKADLADPETTRRSSMAVVGISAAVVVALTAITVAAMLLSLWLLVRIADAIF